MSETETRETTTLFRRSAVEARTGPALGDAWSMQPVPLRIAFALFAGLFVLAVGFAAVTEYPERHRVRGYLAPDAGVRKIHAEVTGTIERVLVDPGARVQAGDPLLEIRPSGGDALPADLASDLVTSLERQRALVRERLAFLEERFESRRTEAGHELARLAAEQERTAALLGSRRELAELYVQHVDAARPLYEDAYLTALDFIGMRERATQARQATTELELRVDELAARRAALSESVRRIELEHDAERHAVREHLARLERDRLQIDARALRVVTAPTSGSIHDLDAARGNRVSPRQVLATVAGSGARFEARLLLPTETARDLEPGGEVSLMLDAYPVARYGTLRGRLDSMSATTYTPEEIADAALASGQVYLARVLLPAEPVLLGEVDAELRPGMQLTADIVLARRSLLAWIFEPLLRVVRASS